MSKKETARPKVELLSVAVNKTILACIDEAAEHEMLSRSAWVRRALMAKAREQVPA